MLLYDSQAVTGSKSFDSGDVRRLRSELPCEVLACEVPYRAVAAGEPTHPVPEALVPAPA
jgi:hypothetical protein